jgi:hypothetical protein
VAAVADHQAPPGLVLLSGEIGYVLIDLGLQRGRQHAAGALPDDLVAQGAGLRGAVFVDYAEHGRAFPTDGATSVCSVTYRSLGKVRPFTSQPEADPQVFSIAPVIAASAAGLVVAALGKGEHLPGELTSPLQILGGAAVALALFTLGMSLNARTRLSPASRT